MKKVLILGAGLSGIGSAELAKKNSLDILLSESNEIDAKIKSKLKKLDIKFEENSHTNAKTYSADLVIKSPGIPDESEIIDSLSKKGFSIISEIEFASLFSSTPAIGVTGSNGKTTTATIIHKLLSDANINCSISGNIGKSFSSVCQKNYDYDIIELSSFQLDGIVNFQPKIAVLTGISEDHMDRYSSFQKYVDSKFRIVMNQTNEDYFIFNSDCSVTTEYINKNSIKSKLLPFTLKKIIDQGAYYKDGIINIISEKNKISMSIENFKLKGKHNIRNAMAAATVANLLQIRKETIRKSLEHFQGVEHRLEKVLTINKVNYINDSKATNINATYYALESMNSPTVWIVGGVDKGNDYSELKKIVSKKVKAIICLGANNLKIIDFFENLVEYIFDVDSMEDAVNTAYKISKSGDNVLLSPACASFDLFDDFEDRGRQFKNAVRKL